MTGSYQHSIDAKGRLFIPAKLREELGAAFYLTVGGDPCLAVYSEEAWERFTAVLTAPPMTKEKRMRVRRVFASTVRCEPDAQGRILIPQQLRKYADLRKDVAVLGAYNRVELWNAERWAAESELTPENIGEVIDDSFGF
ncbi:MAG TPA: division/cell wall cluster transcriptional repressor MraZ [Oscillospiraceae bacterium]|nr:division/cell wall cluster transcriptional repressor MraZ [Oscillospiraceae bacterium]